MSVATKTSSQLDSVKKRLASISEGPERWRWYHGVAFYLGAQVLTFGLSGLVSVANKNKPDSVRDALFGDVSYFRRLKQARITPPSWAFGPAWTLNNFFMIWGALRTLNKPEGTPGRDEYLALQGATWFNFVIFNAVYFSLRSPINALVFTASFFLLTLASGFVAIFRLKDSKVALSLATLFCWLIVALGAATAQALWNKDEFYKVGPFVEPDKKLVRESVQ